MTVSVQIQTFLWILDLTWLYRYLVSNSPAAGTVWP